MKELKNIITINDFNFSQGGASKVAIDTANMLAEAGYNSIFISAVSDDKKTILNKKVIQYKFHGREFLQYDNKIKGMIDGIKCIKFSRYVEKILDDFNPEDTIVHVHGWTKACSSDFFNVLKEKKFSTFLTLHEYFSFCPNGAYFNYKKNCACTKKGGSLECLFCNCDSRSYMFKLYRFTREIQYKRDMDFNYINAIYISEFERKIIEKQIDTPKATVIYNPVSEIDKGTEQKEYDYIYIGRTSKEKGIDLFIELAKKLSNKKFLIVGEHSTSLKNLKSTGWISEKEVDEYLKKSFRLVFPSLWPETFGLNVIKALSVGIPCLVSSNTAAAEFVTNGENGYIFQQGDFSSLEKVAELQLDGNIKKVKTANYIENVISLWKRGIE